MDMLQFYERAFNARLCKNIATGANERLLKEHRIRVNGVYRVFKGDSICAAQVLELAHRNWANSDYVVLYRENDPNRLVPEPLKELKQGSPVMLHERIEFFVRKDNSDQWAEDELYRRHMTKEAALKSLSRY